MRSNTTGEKAQIVYFSHGGGPLPILGDESHKAMIEFLQQLPSHLERPDSILVISAHGKKTSPLCWARVALLCSMTTTDFPMKPMQSRIRPWKR